MDKCHTEVNILENGFLFLYIPAPRKLVLDVGSELVAVAIYVVVFSYKG